MSHIPNNAMPRARAEPDQEKGSRPKASTSRSQIADRLRTRSGAVVAAGIVAAAGLAAAASIPAVRGRIRELAGGGSTSAAAAKAGKKKGKAAKNKSD